MRLHVIFDGPPGPQAGRFVEVENDAGASIRAGEWSERPDGLWDLTIDAALPSAAYAELAPAVGNLRLLLDRARCGLSSVTVGVLLAEEMTRLERAVKLLEPKP